MKNIAVIVVNWNGKKYLKDCFDSLQNQTYKNFKVFFVDNGSEDDSVDFIKEKYLETNLPSVDIFQLKKNTGFCFGYNTGIKKALEDEDTKYVVVLNNDTKLDEKYIEELRSCAERHPEAGSIQPKVLKYFEKNKVDCAGIRIARDGTAHNRGYSKDEKEYKEEKEIFGANGTASLFTRRALEKTALPGHNYFDNDHFVFYEDVDLAWRMKNAGFKTYFCPDALAYHVHSGTAGKASLMKAYYLHRNYFFTVFKNYPCGKLAKTLFWRFLSYLRLVANVFGKKKRETEFVKGQSKIKVVLVILKAWGSVVWNLPSLAKKRKFIRRNIHEIQA
ncbi:MAG: glycosyltransferase family 2 protein [Candidatus Moranbacteria bacterium]|nr:glycosyltransferase family 2 protein [Candidatus Moranbacteria bacterium]